MADVDNGGCRCCGAARLEPILDLGSTPIANALVAVDAPKPDPAYPLAIGLCETCSLVQLLETLPASVIFDDEYPYYSSFSPALLRHAQRHAGMMLDQRALGADSLVVEVGSNDGYLLGNFVDSGVPVLGIDPSPGPAAAAIDRGIPTMVEFFGRDVAAEARRRHGQADLVVANNVMAHVPDLHDFVGGLAEIVADDGVITIENPWVLDLVDHTEFDTIYHEHVCYFSCTAVAALLGRHGLHLQHVEYFPDLHGGTLRWHAGRSERQSEEAAAYLERERARGVATASAYADFADRSRAVIEALPAFLDGLRADGLRLAAYGAAAKGATLLNTAGVGHETLDYVVDRNVHKQGLAMPGCRLPVVDPARLVEDRPDAVLLLAWNFAAEIVEQQAAYLEDGGRFIVPIAASGLPGFYET